MSTVYTVFDSLYKHMLVSDIVGIHQSVQQLLKYVDPILPCGHCHGRRLPLSKVYELTARFPKQRNALISLLINTKLLHSDTLITADTPPPDLFEFWCAIRQQRSDWIRWWIHYLPLDNCKLSPRDARLLVNGAALNQADDSSFVFMGPSSLPPTFPHALASLVARAPPPFQEMIMTELVRRGVILRQDISYFTAAALAQVQFNKTRNKLLHQPDSGATLKTAAVSASEMASSLVSNTPLHNPVNMYGFLRTHPHDVPLDRPVTGNDRGYSNANLLKSASSGFAPVDFTRVALRLTRAGLLFMQKNDRESLTFSEYLDNDAQHAILLDDVAKLRVAKNAFTRDSLLQGLVPFGKYTPFHKFMVQYLHDAGLHPACLVYRAWYQLPALDGLTDDIVNVNYKHLLRFVAKPEKQHMLIEAFRSSPLYIPLQSYNEADNMYFTFYPAEYRGIYHEFSQERPVCMFSLLEDLGFQIRFIFDTVRERREVVSGTQSYIDSFIEFFQKLACFWLTRYAPIHGVIMVFSSAVKMAYSYLDKNKKNKDVDPLLVHTLCHRLCTAAAQLSIRNFDPYKSMLAEKERARLRGESFSNPFDLSDDEEEDDEPKEQMVRVKLIMNADNLSALKAYVDLNLPSYEGFASIDPSACLAWADSFAQMNNSVHAFMLMVESYDLKERIRLGYRQPPFVNTKSHSYRNAVMSQRRANSNTKASTNKTRADAKAEYLLQTQNAPTHVYSLCLSLVMIAIEWIFENQMPASVNIITATVEQAGQSELKKYHPWLLPFVPVGHSLPELASVALGQGLERMRVWAAHSDLGLPWCASNDLHSTDSSESHLSWLIKNLVSAYLSSAAFYKIPVAGAAPPLLKRPVSKSKNDMTMVKPLPSHILRVLTALCVLFYVPFPAELNSWWLATPSLDMDKAEYLRTRDRNKEVISSAAKEGIPLANIVMNQADTKTSENQLVELMLELLHIGMQPAALLSQILAMPPRKGGVMTAPSDDSATLTMYDVDENDISSPEQVGYVNVMERVLQHMVVLTQNEQAWLSHLLFSAPPKDRSRGLPLQAFLDVITKPSRFLLGWTDAKDRAMTSKITVPALTVFKTPDNTTTVTATANKVKNPVYDGLGESNAQRLETVSSMLMMYIRSGQFYMLKTVTQICFPDDPVCYFSAFIDAFNRRQYTKPPVSHSIAGLSNSSSPATTLAWIKRAGDDLRQKVIDSANTDLVYDDAANDFLPQHKVEFGFAADAHLPADHVLQPETYGMHGTDLPMEFYLMQFVSALHKQEQSVTQYNEVKSAIYYNNLPPGDNPLPYIPVLSSIVKRDDGRKQWLGQHKWSRALTEQLWSVFIINHHKTHPLTHYERQYLESMFFSYGWTEGLNTIAKLPGGLISIPPVILYSNVDISQSTEAPVISTTDSVAELTYNSLIQELDALVVVESLCQVSPKERALFIDSVIQQTTRTKTPFILRAALFYQTAAQLMRRTVLPSVDNALSAFTAPLSMPAAIDLDKDVDLANGLTRGRAARLARARDLRKVSDRVVFGVESSGDDMIMSTSAIASRIGANPNSTIDTHNKTTHAGDQFVPPAIAVHMFEEHKDGAVQVIRALIIASLYWKLILEQDLIAKLRANPSYLVNLRAVPNTLTSLERATIGAARRRCSARALWLMTVYDIYSVKLGFNEDFKDFSVFAKHRDMGFVVQDSLFKSNPDPLAPTASTEPELTDAASQAIGEGSEEAMSVTRAYLQDEYDRDINNTKSRISQLMQQLGPSAKNPNAKLPNCLSRRAIVNMPLSLTGLETFPILDQNERVPWPLNQAGEKIKQIRAQLAKHTEMRKSQRAAAGDVSVEDDKDEFNEEDTEAVIHEAMSLEGYVYFDDNFYNDSCEISPSMVLCTVHALFQRCQFKTALTLLSEVNRRSITDRIRQATMGHGLFSAIVHLLHLLFYIADPTIDHIDATGGRRAMGAEFTKLPWPAATEPSEVAVKGRVNEEDDDAWAAGFGINPDQGLFENVSLQRVIYWLHEGWALDEHTIFNVNVSVGGDENTSTHMNNIVSATVTQGVHDIGNKESDIAVMRLIGQVLRGAWCRMAELNLFNPRFTQPVTQNIPASHPKLPSFGPNGVLGPLDLEAGVNAQGVLCGHPDWKDASGLVHWIGSLGAKARLFLLDHLMHSLNMTVIPSCNVATALFSFSPNADDALVDVSSLTQPDLSDASTAKLPLGSLSYNTANSLLWSLPQFTNLLHTARLLALTEEKVLLDSNVRKHFIRVNKPGSTRGVQPSATAITRSAHFTAMLGLLSTRARPTSLSSWQPATLPLVQHIATLLDMSPLTLLGTAPSTLFAEILTRSHTHRASTTLEKGTPRYNKMSGWALLRELFSTGQAQLIVRHDFHSRRYHAVTSALGPTTDTPSPVLGLDTPQGVLGSGAVLGAKSGFAQSVPQRVSLDLTATASYEFAVDLGFGHAYSSGFNYSHAYKHNKTQGSFGHGRHGLFGASADDASLYGYKNNSHRSSKYTWDDSQDVSLLCIEHIVNTVVAYHQHKAVKLGLVALWDSVHYNQLVQLATMIDPLVSSQSFWYRSLGYAFWARLQLLFPTSDTKNKTLEPSKTEWRWMTSAIHGKSWLSRLEEGITRYIERAPDSDAFRTGNGKPLVFHVPGKEYSLELQVELMLCAFAAFQEALHPLGMLYIQVEMYQRGAFTKHWYYTPSSRHFDALWQRATTLVNIESPEWLEQKVRAIFAEVQDIYNGITPYASFLSQSECNFNDDIPIELQQAYPQLPPHSPDDELLDALYGDDEDEYEDGEGEEDYYEGDEGDVEEMEDMEEDAVEGDEGDEDYEEDYEEDEDLEETLVADEDMILDPLTANSQQVQQQPKSVQQPQVAAIDMSQPTSTLPPVKLEEDRSDEYEEYTEYDEDEDDDDPGFASTGSTASSTGKQPNTKAPLIERAPIQPAKPIALDLTERPKEVLEDGEVSQVKFSVATDD